MDTKQMRWAASALSTEAAQAANLRADLPAEDGVMRIGATRIGHAYIFERGNPNPASDSDLLFKYDAAGNQIRREVKKVS
ncbi:hypothetical protein [Sphingobacterium paludis]|uniref:Uncharacterized protein n=1 Tax=Sphingobacterium paludis TaxID=1476465 RepID=A0A4V3E2T0_9SPHI|nr:hypothetical protein [Sphingobacterium paludis]TDS17648.1 hypothetical protein B0I21_101519 [Sphingobacterium paludis]